MALKGTEKNSIFGLKGITPKKSEGLGQTAKTEPRTGNKLEKNTKSDLSLKGQTPSKYTDNLPK